jgi:hypothetical protein
MSEPRKQTPYLLRFIMINALVGISVYEAWKQGGHLTGKVIAIYVVMVIIANALMYFGARARRNLARR